MKLPSHVEHIGSFIRPAELLQAREKYQKKEITTHEALEAEHNAISALVKKLVQNNVRPITTGEYDRFFFYDGFVEKLDGFEIIPGISQDNLRMACPDYALLAKFDQMHLINGVVCKGKIHNSKSPVLDQWLHLRSLLSEAKWKNCKMTMLSPIWWHLHTRTGKAYPSNVYKNDEEYFQDLAQAYRKEFQSLYEDGLRSVQIDDPDLAFFCHEPMLEGIKADGEDADAMLDKYIRAHNMCLREKPEGLHVGIHLCRGNMGTMHFAAGGYERIAKKLFNELDYDTFFLEYDNERSGGFEPLRYLPKTKNVVLGIVTTKSATMESIADLKERVMQAADVIAAGQNTTREDALQRIAVSPQCGFASACFTAGDGMTEDLEMAKMKLLNDLAKEIWG